jgi:hypothetical protein
MSMSALTHRYRFAMLDQTLGVAPGPDEEPMEDRCHLQWVEHDDGRRGERLDEDDCSRSRSGSVSI